MYYNISFDIAAILMLIVIAAGMNTVLYTDTTYTSTCGDTCTL